MAAGRIKFAYARRTGAGTTELAAAPGAGLKHVVIHCLLSQSAAAVIATLEQGTTDLITLEDINSIALSGSRFDPVAEGAANAALNFTTVGTGNGSCTIAYYTTEA